MATEVHGDGAVAGRDQLGRQETVLVPEVAEARRHDDQRPAALVGVGNAPARAVEEEGVGGGHGMAPCAGGGRVHAFL